MIHNSFRLYVYIQNCGLFHKINKYFPHSDLIPNRLPVSTCLFLYSLIRFDCCNPTFSFCCFVTFLVLNFVFTIFFKIVICLLKNIYWQIELINIDYLWIVMQSFRWTSAHDVRLEWNNFMTRQKKELRIRFVVHYPDKRDDVSRRQFFLQFSPATSFGSHALLITPHREGFQSQFGPLTVPRY